MFFIFSESSEKMTIFFLFLKVHYNQDIVRCDLGIFFSQYEHYMMTSTESRGLFDLFLGLMSKTENYLSLEANGAMNQNQFDFIRCSFCFNFDIPSSLFFSPTVLFRTTCRKRTKCGRSESIFLESNTYGPLSSL